MVVAVVIARAFPPIAAVRVAVGAAGGGIRANWFDTHLRLAHGLFNHNGCAACGRVAIIVAARRAVVVAAVIVVAIIVAAVIVTAAVARAAVAVGKRTRRHNKSQTENQQCKHSDL